MPTHLKLPPGWSLKYKDTYLNGKGLPQNTTPDTSDPYPEPPKSDPTLF
jgi:hypothetical protein